MKRQFRAILITFMLFAIVLPTPVMAAGASSVSTITVSLRQSGSRKCRTILSGVKMRIRARSDEAYDAEEELIYKTLNPAVADVDAGGVITTRRAGKADILILTKDGRLTAAIRLSVKDRLFATQEKGTLSEKTSALR